MPDASPPDQLADAEGELEQMRSWAVSATQACDRAYVALAAAETQLSAALARAERAETSRDAEAIKFADELEGWFHRGSYRPGDHLPSSWQYDLGGRIARNMRLVLRALRSCPDAALAPPATAEET